MNPQTKLILAIVKHPITQYTQHITVYYVAEYIVEPSETQML